MSRIFIEAFIVGVVVCSAASLGKERECIFQDTCERCLSADFNCSWCTDKTYDRRYRCLTREELLMNGCSDEEIWENEQEVQVLRDSELRDYQGVGDRAVQVQPQKIYMKLVKSYPQRIKLTYRPARNHTLDLYYLMDLTWTMRDDKKTLVAMGAQLAAALHNLTGNYRLGFGSFADKPAMPMIMPQLRENPCAAEHEVCEPTYGFRHHLPLTADVGDFVRSVNASRVTGNLDNLEGGLDALMQVIVCPDVIGWKADARKIVIFATNGFMHFAGDGLLAGIARNNDKQCHLDVASGEYLATLDYDYPSLEEIYRELMRRKVNVIFAVTEGVVATYRQISALMREISNVEILSADSSNILELIEKSYESFVKRAQFTDDSPPFIRLDYETDCGGEFSTLRPQSYCKNVGMGKQVEFYINVTLTDFPTDGIYTRKIRIEESSLSELLEIDVEIQKPCPCSEDPIDDEYGRFQCSENGYMQCGMCVCDEGWAGVFCTCPTDSSNSSTTSETIERECRQPFTSPPELGPVCSNRGECDCGTCFCYQGYTGKYCECPECDADCDLERADCYCGRCVCKYGWSGGGGNRCNCKESTDGCIAPNGEICSSRGHCHCGGCDCDGPYLGRFCEIGSENENKLCVFYEPCVKCLIQEQQQQKQQQMGIPITSTCVNITEICSRAAGMPGDNFQHAFVSENIDADIRCLARLTNDGGDLKCDHFFTYKSLTPMENYLLIQVNSCEPINYYAMIGYISLGTFLLGLMIMFAIGMFIREQDRREYARFEEEQRKSTLLMESPIYRDPIRVYKVPEEYHE